MECIKKMVNEELERGWIGSNTSCPYYPCHFQGQDCTFCYCPFYPCNDEDLGNMLTGKRGNQVWACSDCLLIHTGPVCRYIMDRARELGIEKAGDERFKDIFKEVKERFYRPGRALMVVGATSDAGKSTIVAGICRILHRRGYVVAPFKSQNMSLNAKATRMGTEIAMAQTVQAAACGLKNPDSHMNPILLKPMRDTRSQVIVCGKPYRDYDVGGYYGEFVPGPGRDIVRENVEFLKRHYQYVIMEGAGSPAEINIYDRDIANMGAAVIADADVLLVVNVEWGGAFAYALGTVELIPEPDRSRIKGVIFNNIRGDLDRFKEGVPEFERLCGLPVVGCIPHADLTLPSEDSEALRGTRRMGSGSCLIGVVKYPRIANFTDLDPLYLEDVSVVFVEEAGDLDGVDAVILPGTKNSVSDMLWMEERGIADRVRSLRGRIPIAGVCGGFQMMGRTLDDSEGIESGAPRVLDGLGFFDMTTRFGEYSKRMVNSTGRLLAGDGGDITGYELHMGQSDIREKPLFEIENNIDKGPTEEGAYREDEMLYGTYLHGIFDKKPFRSFLLSHIRHEGRSYDTSKVQDYDDVLEANIKKLADVCEENMDVGFLMDLLGAGR